MAIRMVLETNRPHGEPDLYCPQVFCDYCAERIEDAAEGNYEWPVGEQHRPLGPTYQVHKRCCRSLEATVLGRLGPGHDWMSSELRVLPAQLEANLNVNQDEAVESARVLAMP